MKTLARQVLGFMEYEQGTVNYSARDKAKTSAKIKASRRKLKASLRKNNRTIDV